MTSYEKEVSKLICTQAIKKLRLMRFWYESESGAAWRTIEPYLLGIKDNGKGNAYVTGYVYPSTEYKRTNKNDGQGHYLLRKIDLNKFEIMEETFDHIRFDDVRIFGDLKTIEIICRVDLGRGQ